MAKKVTKYEANDGTLFDTEAEATLHERTKASLRALETAVDGICTYGKVDCADLVDYLSDPNHHLTMCVVNLYRDSGGK